MSEHGTNHRCIDPKRHPRIAALFPGVILPEHVFDAFEKRLAEDEAEETEWVDQPIPLLRSQTTYKILTLRENTNHDPQV